MSWKSLAKWRAWAVSAAPVAPSETVRPSLMNGGMKISFLLVFSQLEGKLFRLLEISLGNSHYGGPEALGRGFNALISSVFAPEKRVAGRS